MLILKTKLFAPAVHKNVMERPRLFTSLEASGCPILLISASAGSGKSTLISQWLQQKDESFSWFSIDSEDNSLLRFFTYFVELLRIHTPVIGAEALALQNKTQVEFNESALTALINEILFYQQKVRVVIDDYHLIDNEEIHRMMSFLMNNLPFNLNMIIMSRSVAPFATAGLKSKGIVYEIKQDKLAFNLEETEKYCNDKLKLNLSFELIRKIHNETEGWVTALHLSTLFMEQSDKKSERLDKLEGDPYYIFDYLMEEVLEKLPKEIKDFLVATSIFDRFSIQLCNAVLENENSELMIRKLDEQNLFIIPLDEGRGWYRYHHLLNPFLQKYQLQQEKKEIAQEAGRWFFQNQFWEESYNYACMAEDYDFAMKSFEKFGGKSWGLEKETQNFRLLSKLPPTFLNNSVTAKIHYAKELYLMHKYDLILPAIEEIKILLEKLKDRSEKEKAEARALSVEAHYFFAIDNFETSIEKSRLALTKLEEGAVFWKASIMLPLSWSIFLHGDGDTAAAQNLFKESRTVALATGDITRIIYCYNQEIVGERVLGNLTKSKALIEEAMEFLESENLNRTSLASEIIASKAICFAFEGNYKEAIKIAEKALFYLKDNKQISHTLHYVQVILGDLLARTGYKNRAKEMVQNNRELHLKFKFPQWIVNMTYVTWGYIALKEEDTLSLQQWLEETQIEKESLNASNESLFLIYGRILFEKKQYDRALKIFEEIHEMAIRGRRILSVIAFEVDLALFFYHLKDTARLEETVIKLLNSCAKTGVIGYLYGQSDAVIAILQYVLANKLYHHENAFFPRSFVTSQIRKLKEFTADKELFQVLPGSQNISLSRREVDLLEQLAMGKTNQMIADSMFISLNTVKTHLKKINIKLDVTCRTHAVTKAQEMGLIA